MSLASDLEKTIKDLHAGRPLDYSNLRQVMDAIRKLEDASKFKDPAFEHHMTNRSNPHLLRLNQIDGGVIYYDEDNARIVFAVDDQTQLYSYSDLFHINPFNYDQDFRVDGLNTDSLIHVDAANNRVGIGTESPEDKLHVYGGNILLENAQSLRIKTSGGVAHSVITMGGGDVVNINPYSGLSIITTGNRAGSVIRQLVNENQSGAGTRIDLGDGINNLTSANNFLIFADRVGSTIVGRIRSDGAGGTVYVTTSDRRLKRDIRDIEDALAILMRVRARKFERVENPGETRYGFVAQELFDDYPQAAFEGSDEIDENGNLVDPWNVDLVQLVPVLVGAVQEQQKKIEELEKRLDQKSGFAYQIWKKLTKIFKR